MEAGGSPWSTARSRSSTSGGGNGHHWDPRYPDFPGTFDGETIHSHHYIGPDDPLDLHGKRVLVVGIGNSAVDIASESPQGCRREGVHLHAQRRLGDAGHLFGQPIGKLVKTNPFLPLRLQRWLARPILYLASGRMEDFGLPPQPRLSRGASDRLQRAAPAPRLG